MAVRTLGSLPRRLAALCLALLISQTASGSLMAGAGGKGADSKAKSADASEQVIAAEQPKFLDKEEEDDDAAKSAAAAEDETGAVVERAEGPREEHLTRARTWNGDLRSLPQTEPRRRERPERGESYRFAPRLLPGATPSEPATPTSAPVISSNPPTPGLDFEGLDFANWGAGHPPDTNGDVGPSHYIQTINTSLGIYDKSSGVRVAAFTFDTFMSQGNFGNLCDTENFGDPVVLYDTFDDRWVITDFAFQLDGGGNINPPRVFQCFAVSKSGDPVSGGWNFYSIENAGGIDDYPKFGIWPDGLYMSANIFGYPAGSGFINARVWAFNKAQMYAGSPTVQIVSFNAPAGDFTLLPSNARLQAGTPPAGRPNFFLSSSLFLNALSVYKFHVDWTTIGLSTFGAPDTPIAATAWPNANPLVANAPSLGGNNLDTLGVRAMMQNQYSNIGGAESLWATHTVRRANAAGFAAPRWYQVNVTGGAVAPTIPQATTWDPDGANVMHRFMPSLAVNRNGDLALGYSTSSASTKPAIKYAGRLAGDPINTFSQAETVLIQGNGTQTGNCGSSACMRWGDYSAMTLDPNGCTFWYTNMYYDVDGLNHHTRIGSFTFPACTTVGNGTLTGTVTNSATTNPMAGVTVSLGSRATTTNGSGVYSFLVPAGTYASVTASFPGFVSSTFTNIVVTDGGTTTQDFALSSAATAGCLTDTTQADFQAGVLTNCDRNSSPGDVQLASPTLIDQQNTSLINSGFGFTDANWLGQTFTAGVTGPVTAVDLNLFSLNCSMVTMPNVTVSIRNAAGNVPTGADLGTATIPGFCRGSAAFSTATFASPVTITAGTQYAIVWRAAAPIPGTGVYAGTVSSANPYAAGRRSSSADSGLTWTGAAGTANNDHGFRVYINQGFVPSGTFVSFLKDANPSLGAVPHWNTLSWNATTPAGTNVQFQAAASNNPGGPFTFVGPDGTTGTFFTSGGSLAQFNGNRYLEYQASLTSSSSTATPAINDVTVCFQDVPTTTTAITSDTPDASVFGAPVAVTYTVTANAPSGNTITGNVVVTDGVDMCTGTVAAGGCALTLHTVGPHTLTATYQGDPNFLASPPSVGEPHTVIKADTTAAITGDTPEPSVTGAPVLVSYTVTVAAPGSGTPTGTVTVTDGVAFCTGTLPALSCSITLTGVGLHGLTATYNGDASFNASPDSAVEPHTVDKADTTASITADPTDPSVVGQAVTISYAVAVNAPGSGTPTGTVTVTDGVAVCTGTLPALSCSITLTTAGAHSLTATYNGDASFNASPASAAEPHTVAKADTTAAITGDSPDPSGAGQAVPVTFTVAVDLPGSGTPTGNVTVSDGTDSCTGTVAAGTCSITLTTVGSRILTATYAGDASFNASPASAGEPHTVSQASTTTTITGSVPNPSFPGQAVTVSYTVVVNAPASGAPTGNVTVTDGVDSCTATVAAGSCLITFSTSGPRVVTAAYAGDASFTSSTSAPFSQIVLVPNNTPALAKDVLIGSVSTDTLGPVPQDHNFFRYRATAGRSYCVEVDNGRTETTVLDTFLTVYQADGTTPIGANDNIADEPGGPLLSRVCYIAAVSEDNLADVTSALGGNPGVFRVRVVDTTTFAPWFFATAPFESFILIKNTTGAAHNVTVTLLDATGAPATAPQSGVMPANGSYNLQITAPPPVGFGVTSVFGGVLIAHDGPPGAVGASVTSIDFVSGVSFDTPAYPRLDPRR